MKKYKYKNAIKLILILLTSTFINSRCDKAFDAPPLEEIGQLPVNYSIKELKSRHTAKGSFETINNDVVISGIITANDQSGNFYQEIIIQDSTGAIPVVISGNDLYTTYPIGRKVFIKLKGLTLGDYGGVIQLGAGVDNSVAYQAKLIPIAYPLANNFIVKGSYNNNLAPINVSINQLNTNIQNEYQSCLISIDQMQFQPTDLGKTYADTTKEESAINYILSNGLGDSITLRNSSYALFAGNKIPEGNGKITAIFGIFNNTTQLTIRDTNDINFTHSRFNKLEALYNFNEVNTSSGSNDPTPVPTSDGVVFGNFKAVNVSENATKSNAFSYCNWATGATDGSDNFNGNIDFSKYYEVTIAPNNTYLSLQKISFSIGRTGSGIRKAVIRSSIDNFAANLKVETPITNTDLQVISGNIIQLADKSLASEDGIKIMLDSSYTHITSPIRFRFYGYNAEDTAGTFIIDNVAFEGFTKTL